MPALLAVLSSLLWGSADFGGGLASRRLPAPAVVAWSQLAGLLGASTVVVATGAWRGPAGWLPWAPAAGAAGGAALLAFYLALASGRMSVVSPIASLGVLVPVLGGLATGDRPSGAQWAGMVLAVGGAFAASGPELRGAVGRRSVALAAGAGVGFGLALLLMARGALANPAMTMAGMRATSVLAFALVGLARRTAGGVAPRDLPVLAAVGLADVGANLLYGVAVRSELLSVVAVLGALYPVATVLLARVVLAERLAPVQRFGVVGALGGVVLLAAS